MPKRFNWDGVPLTFVGQSGNFAGLFVRGGKESRGNRSLGIMFRIWNGMIDASFDRRVRNAFVRSIFPMTSHENSNSSD